MTAEEWLTLKVGDTIVTTRGGLRREILDVIRIAGQTGQKGRTRTVVTVVHTRRADRKLTIANTDDVGGIRFSLERRR